MHETLGQSSWMDHFFISENLQQLLHTINIPTHLFACAAGCDRIDHYLIMMMLLSITIALLSRASRISVPRILSEFLTPFWTDDLDRLKESSIDIHSLWCFCGKPR